MARIRFLRRLGLVFYPLTIPQAVKDPATGEIAYIAEEKAVAQALTELNARVKTLEALIANNVVERLNVANEFNIYGKTNMVLSGSGAPTFEPDFVGQRYLDLTARVTYTAYNTDSAGGWK